MASQLQLDVVVGQFPDWRATLEPKYGMIRWGGYYAVPNPL